MANHSYVKNLEDLQFWFEQLDSTAWSLYRGHNSSQNGRMLSSNLIYKNDGDTTNQEESWQLLEKIIGMNSHGGGLFTVYVPHKSPNKGCYQWVKITGEAGNQAGISGYPGQVGLLPADEVQRRINEAVEKERLLRRIEDLEGAQSAQRSTLEMFMDKVMDELDLNRVVDQIGSIFNHAMQSKSKVPVTLQGAPGEQITTEHRDNVTSEQGYEYDERAIVFLDHVRPHFQSDEEFYGFLNILAEKFASNPGMYISLVKGSM